MMTNWEQSQVNGALCNASGTANTSSCSGRRGLVVGVVALCALTVAQRTTRGQVNLVINPGFELPGFGGDNYRYLDGGNSTFLTGWTWFYDGVNEPSYVWHKSRYPVFHGDYSAGVNDGDACESIVPTVPGHSYLWSIHALGDDGGNLRLRAGSTDVSFNPAVVGVPTGVFSGLAEWKRVTVEFTALSTSTGIRIDDQAQGLLFGGHGIDDISVVECVQVFVPPVPMSACPSHMVSFGTKAQGTAVGGTLAYQWQWRPIGSTLWLDVLNGTNIDPSADEPAFDALGATLASVTMTNSIGNSTAVAGGRREVQVVVSNSCGSVTSDVATWSICPADVNCDGFVTGDDFDSFVAAFEAGAPSADFDQNGFVNGDDFDQYVVLFESGC